jgi:predicted RNA-binding protein with PUA-like domain
MANWLFKTEPDDYSWQQLVADGQTVWNGVRNNQALQFLRQVSKDDRILFYHTGKEKQIVAIARAVSMPYPDPAEVNEKLVVVDIEPLEMLKQPVTLKAIKADPRFDDFLLVRNSRLSIMPVSPDLWEAIIGMSEI